MLKQGAYEQIITQELKQKLKELNINEFLIEKEPLDVEEAKTVLSNFISSVIKKALRFIRENNKKDDKKIGYGEVLLRYHKSEGNIGEA